MAARAPRKRPVPRGSTWPEAARILRSAIEQGRYDTEIDPYLNARQLPLVERILSGPPATGDTSTVAFVSLIEKLRRWEAGKPVVKSLNSSMRGQLRVLVRERLDERHDVEALARERQLTERQLAVLRLYVLSDRRLKLREVASELGISYGTATNIVHALAVKLGLRPPSPSQDPRLPTCRRTVLQLRTLTDEELLARVAAKRYPNVRRFRTLYREEFRCVRDRGLLDVLYPERPTRSLTALREALRELPEAEIEALAAGLDDLERDVLRLRGLADPPVSRRWFRARTDGPRCTRLSVVETALLRRVRVLAPGDAAPARASRVGPTWQRPDPAEQAGGSPAASDPRAALEVVRRLAVHGEVKTCLLALQAQGHDVEAIARGVGLNAREQAVLARLAETGERPTPTAVAAELEISYGYTAALLARLRTKLRPWGGTALGAEQLAGVTDDELVEAIAAGGYLTPLELRRWSACLFQVALDRGLLDRLFPTRPTRALAKLREAVRSVPEDELERIAQGLSDLERDVLRHRALAPQPVSPNWFRQRPDAPTRGDLSSVERRLTSLIELRDVPAVAEKIRLGQHSGLGRSQLLATPPKPKTRARVAELLRRRMAETGEDLDAIVRDLRLRPRHRAVMRAYVLADERPPLKELAAGLGLRVSAVLDATAAIEARFQGDRLDARSLQRYRAMSDAELEAKFSALGIKTRSAAYLRARKLATVALERGVLDRLFPIPRSVTVERLHSSVSRLTPERRLEIEADLSPLERQVWQLCVEQPLPIGPAGLPRALAQVAGLTTGAFTRTAKSLTQRVRRRKRPEDALIKLRDVVRRLGPERLAELRRRLPPQRLEILELRALPAEPVPRTMLSRRWGLTSERVRQLEHRLCADLLELERTGDWRVVVPRPRARPPKPGRESGQVRLERLRAAVASLDGHALELVRAGLRRSELAILEHRLLPEEPLTIAETHRRTGVPVGTLHPAECRFERKLGALLARRPSGRERRPRRRRSEPAPAATRGEARG